jgi:hypothetical protein
MVVDFSNYDQSIRFENSTLKMKGAFLNGDISVSGGAWAAVNSASYNVYGSSGIAVGFASLLPNDVSSSGIITHDRNVVQVSSSFSFDRTFSVIPTGLQMVGHFDSSGNLLQISSDSVIQVTGRLCGTEVNGLTLAGITFSPSGAIRVRIFLGRGRLENFSSGIGYRTRSLRLCNIVESLSVGAVRKDLSATIGLSLLNHQLNA